jgi:hypothetical protein
VVTPNAGRHNGERNEQASASGNSDVRAEEKHQCRYKQLAASHAEHTANDTHDEPERDTC